MFEFFILILPTVIKIGKIQFQELGVYVIPFLENIKILFAYLAQENKEEKEIQNPIRILMDVGTRKKETCLLLSI